ncbi:conserved hypothetical protein [Luminiphilus syltensis NOR5-1B]|uniref:Uncharacterized protein n=1 Tax=Luminiphilus syltensis NOR5-1B TaxID=565045 RepID=B8KU34_9GAMM|nr:conserved hypothetical protein [Luminiphilus syltensis NOR5-1B]
MGWVITHWLLLTTGAYADNPEAEIEYLLSAIGDSGCEFLRNGRVHDAEDAEAHLRMKYRNGFRYVSTAEEFIDRLASKSSITRRPYFIDCDQDASSPSGEWLYQRLNEYRTKKVYKESTTGEKPTVMP